MPNLELPHPSEWGHELDPIGPAEIIERLTLETKQAIDKYLVLPDGPEPCKDKDGYSRVSVLVPLSREFFDQLMNGATGYRAHYSVGIKAGEYFNRRLVEAIAPMIVHAEHLYSRQFDRYLCHRSLHGRFSKVWFTNKLTDPSELHFP